MAKPVAANNCQLQGTNLIFTVGEDAALVYLLIRNERQQKTVWPQQSVSIIKGPDQVVDLAELERDPSSVLEVGPYMCAIVVQNTQKENSDVTRFNFELNIEQIRDLEIAFMRKVTQKALKLSDRLEAVARSIEELKKASANPVSSEEAKKVSEDLAKLSTEQKKLAEQFAWLTSKVGQLQSTLVTDEKLRQELSQMNEKLVGLMGTKISAAFRNDLPVLLENSLEPIRQAIQGFEGSVRNLAELEASVRELANRPTPGPARDPDRNPNPLRNPVPARRKVFGLPLWLGGLLVLVLIAFLAWYFWPHGNKTVAEKKTKTVESSVTPVGTVKTEKTESSMVSVPVPAPAVTNAPAAIVPPPLPPPSPNVDEWKNRLMAAMDGQSEAQKQRDRLLEENSKLHFALIQEQTNHPPMVQIGGDMGRGAIINIGGTMSNVTTCEPKVVKPYVVEPRVVPTPEPRIIDRVIEKQVPAPATQSCVPAPTYYQYACAQPAPVPAPAPNYCYQYSYSQPAPQCSPPPPPMINRYCYQPNPPSCSGNGWYVQTPILSFGKGRPAPPPPLGFLFEPGGGPCGPGPGFGPMGPPCR